MTTGNWDDYLSADESTGYQTGDLAETWNEHAAQSNAGIAAADDAINANNDALYEAASHLGTDPAAVQNSLQEAVEQFNATNQAQWASLGVDAPEQIGEYGDFSEQ
jgi:hypothetical protein